MTVLDSWAVLAWLDGEQPATDLVEGVIAGRPAMSWVNLVEVAYRLERDHGRIASDATVEALRAALNVELPTVERMKAVARLKAEHPIALGDCFAIATAVAAGAELWTGDPEIIDADGLPCEVRDLRAAPLT